MPEILYEAIVLSLLNQLVFLALASLASWLQPAGGGPKVVAWLYLTGDHFSFQIETLLQPAILGVLSGYALRSDLNLTVLRYLAMPVVHPTRRAYDYAFGDITTDRFVIVTYGDGTMIYGYFGPNSLASSASDRGDIFLERLYDVEEGVWKPTEPPKSALLMLKDVRTVEFIEPAKDT